MTKPERPLTHTYIDNQTIDGVIVALDLADPHRWSGWALETAVRTTCILLALDRVRISPPSSRGGQKVQSYVGMPGNYGVIGSVLASIIEPYYPDVSTTRAATGTVLRWAEDNPARVADAFHQLQQQANYIGWLDYEVEHGWTTTSAMFNGLVDERFLGVVSKSSGIDLGELHTILELSRRHDIVQRWSQPGYRGQDKETAKTLFVVGALLRGRHYDRVCELTGSSVIHHPFRESILKPLKRADTEPFRASNTLEYLSKIVLAASMKQRSTADRIRAWGEGVAVLRRAILDEERVIIPPDDIVDENALRFAIRAAQDAGIRAHSKILDRVLEQAIGLALGAASSFLLHPWLFPVGYYGGRLIDQGIENLISRSWSRSEWRLRRLAYAIPGRLTATGCVLRSPAKPSWKDPPK
jgi:hypothetical protein